jgi:hypothetical protein
MYTDAQRLMKDLLIVLPFAYLVDVILFWVAVIIFNVWFRSSHDKPILEYLLQTIGACAIGLVTRGVSGRPLHFFWQNVSESRLVVHLIVATLAGFVATYPYHEILEMTGSPSSADNFYIGRIITMVAVCGVLFVTYCVSVIISQSRAGLQDEKNISEVKNRGRRGKKGKAFVFENAWYIHLAVIASLVILIDLIVQQNARLTLEMFGLFGGVLLIFVAFNLCWSRRLKGPAYYEPLKDDSKES